MKMTETGEGSVRGMCNKTTETDQRGTTEIMYRILLVDDEILVRDAIRENIDWKAMDCELVGRL